MAGELIAQLSPGDFYRETTVGYDDTTFSVVVGQQTMPAAGGTPNGVVRGVGLNKVLLATLAQEYYQASFIIPANLTMGTGITIVLHLTDDGKNAADLGTAVELGITAFNVDGTGFNVNLGANNGTEETTAITLSSTSGNVVSGTIAIPIAQLASAAVGNRVLIRLRRVGTSTSDTCPGRPVLIGAYVHNT